MQLRNLTPSAFKDLHMRFPKTNKSLSVLRAQERQNIGSKISEQFYTFTFDIKVCYRSEFDEFST